MFSKCVSVWSRSEAAISSYAMGAFYSDNPPTEDAIVKKRLVLTFLAVCAVSCFVGCSKQADEPEPVEDPFAVEEPEPSASVIFATDYVASA